ncbi:hypothetical protein WMZ97_01650 [Lentibacillus sp. N15]|uniref:hypothetical protein n=1 Tax=Lentibacillus songyuanensis TaxID=3136161 RepID=UPI0031BA1A3A
MLTETLIYLAGGLFIIWIGYVIWKKQAFSLLAGMGKNPVNKERLGKRLGFLFISLGILVIITPFLIMLFGSIMKTITGVLALADCIIILGVVILDQIGF